MTRLDILELSGSHRQIGLQHGQLSRARIRRFLDDRLARINAVLYEPQTLVGLAPLIGQYHGAIAEAAPHLLEEIDGLAQGAGITPDAALLLQLRREVTGYRSIGPLASGDCSTLLVDTRDGPLLAQTVDLNGNLAPEISALRIEHASGKRTVLMLSFTGLLGYLGMNDRGLAIGINLVLGGAWGPGVPGYLALRFLLDKADTVEEALALLGTLPLASSRSYTLCDGNHSAMIEYRPGEVRRLPSVARVHTNHFLSPSLAVHDQLNPFAKVSSIRRLEACEQWLAQAPGTLTANDVLAFFATRPVYVPPTEDVRKESTVAAVVMNPMQRMMHVQLTPSGPIQALPVRTAARTPA